MDALLRRTRNHFAVLRIHTRAPITAPDRVDSELITVLRKHAPIWIVLHVNHADELQGDALEAIAKLREAGVSLLNQSVLLRGVNDSPVVLKALCERLVELGVFPYYLHHTDPVPGNAHFRVPVKEGLEIHHQLQQQVSGVALPRYVVDLGDGSGKIPVSDAQKTGRLM